MRQAVRLDHVTVTCLFLQQPPAAESSPDEKPSAGTQDSQQPPGEINPSIDWSVSVKHTDFKTNFCSSLILL